MIIPEHLKSHQYTGKNKKWNFFIIDFMDVTLHIVSLYMVLLYTIYYYKKEYTNYSYLMMNWKNLKNNPPAEGCNICVKIGSNYETYIFKRYTHYSWELYKYPRSFGPDKIPDEALYINLDEIK